MAAATAYLGFMWVGSYKLETRFSELREEAKGVCMQRGSGTPTAEQMQEKLLGLAAAHGVQLSDVEVSIHAIGEGHDTGAGAQVQTSLGGIEGLKMSGTMAELHARMQAKQWLWHGDQVLSTSCTLERTLERVLPPMPGVDPL